jgi:hypothetical protein
MNLQENISRIKEVMGLILEEKLPSGFDKVKKLLYVYDKDVENLQKFLISKKYDLGHYGPNKDGVDGKYGVVTRRFHEKYLNNISPTKSEPDKTNDSSNTSGDVILMGGLDYRSGDLKISQQVEVLKSSSNKNVIGHRYNQFSNVANSISENPDATVVLFSAGCAYSSKVASLIKNKNKLFIVEPYAISQGTSSSVQSAVSQGVPSSNVITGPSKGRGDGVVGGSKKTPSGYGHWDALKYVGKLI